MGSTVGSSTRPGFPRRSPGLHPRNDQTKPSVVSLGVLGAGGVGTAKTGAPGSFIGQDGGDAGPADGDLTPGTGGSPGWNCAHTAVEGHTGTDGNPGAYGTWGTIHVLPPA